MERRRAHEGRIWLATVFMLGLFGGLFARLCWIQGKDGDWYSDMAYRQHHAHVPLAVRRGTIYDAVRKSETYQKLQESFADCTPTPVQGPRPKSLMAQQAEAKAAQDARDVARPRPKTARQRKREADPNDLTSLLSDLGGDDATTASEG